ncbi:MAG: ABC transporter ATP-binding protein, partial [Actinobacteria bacterium]|nr:ABC transporter ATP-binding protein [Actinomycetota bacterium]
DIDFRVEPGESIGLVGANGSGKSTLLKILTRVMYPYAGSVEVAGRVGALIEVSAGIHPELSGRENVYLNGAILGINPKELSRKFDEIVDFSGIERFIDTPVKNYSSGMYVRLGFAIAINVSPDILLVDEVLAVGDAEFQQKCAAKFKELKGSGCTIVVVSHAMEMIKDLCDSGAWLEHGEVQATGTAQEITRAYLTQVAEHTGESLSDLDPSVDGPSPETPTTEPEAPTTEPEAPTTEPVDSAEPYATPPIIR